MVLSYSEYWKKFEAYTIFWNIFLLYQDTVQK